MPVFPVVAMQGFDFKNSIITVKRYDFKSVFNLRMISKLK